MTQDVFVSSQWRSLRAGCFWLESRRGFPNQLREWRFDKACQTWHNGNVCNGLVIGRVAPTIFSNRGVRHAHGEDARTAPSGHHHSNKEFTGERET